jgi:tRNA threonylcarbamoyladenosine biosynthesis protein TsaB
MLLSFHTCGSTATIALGLPSDSPSPDHIRIVEMVAIPGRTYAARLIPEGAALLGRHHVNLQAIEAIVVVNGPGSFTGVRVGVSTAKGLAEGAGIPLIAVSRLALLASASGLPHVLTAVDAGRGDYYFGEYRNGETLLETLLSREETVARASQPGAGVLVCDESNDASSGAAACAALAFSGPMYMQPPDAGEALRFAMPRWRARLFDDPATLEANYLRRPDAEVKRAVAAGT